MARFRQPNELITTDDKLFMWQLYVLARTSYHMNENNIVHVAALRACTYFLPHEQNA